MSGSLAIRALARAAAAVVLLASYTCFAEEAAPEEDAGAATWQAAQAAMQRGPQTIQLRDQAMLQLPAGYGFVPAKEGAAVMELMGNGTDERFIGLIFPQSEAQWFVTMEFESSGYIKDDEKINPEELLKINEQKFKELGVGADTIKRLYLSKGFSVTLLTRLATNLREVNVPGCGDYVATAAEADETAAGKPGTDGQDGRSGSDPSDGAGSR